MSDNKKLTNEQMDIEMKALELEERRLRISTMRDEIDRKKMKDAENESIYKERGIVLSDTYRNNHLKHANCTHKKGGMGMDGLAGRGDDTEYAVFKMRWLDGRLWIRCLRCAKTWHPIRLQQFGDVVDGKLVKPMAPYITVDEALKAFNEAEQEYKAACAFPTRNQTAATSSYQFHTPEARERYEKVHDNLNFA